jgi:hypothetical protein
MIEEPSPLNEADIVYPPFHEKFVRAKYVQLIQDVGGKEEREEMI